MEEIYIEGFCARPFRKMDVDDMFIIICMRKGKSTAKVSKLLKIDPSCILKRVRKIDRLLPELFMMKETEGYKKTGEWWATKRFLTEKGVAFADACETFLKKIATYPHF